MTENNKDLKCSMDLRVKPEDDRRGESGRSMVEMLGTLAIIGVLSVGGIAGYTYAMNRYYTNELLAGASERAVLVTAQIASGRKPSLKEFANHTTAGGTFETDDESIRVYTDGIGIPVSDVKGAVCENLIKATEGTDILITDIDENEISADDCAEESNDLLFVFETGIGAPEAVEKVCTEIAGDKPGACSKCLSMEEEGEAWWIDSDELCGAGERCHEGNCVALEGGECVKNSDCNDGEFCLYSYVDDVTGPTEGGECVSALESRGGEIFGGFMSDPIMNWFSAKNFCQALGTNLGYRYDVHEMLPIFSLPQYTGMDCTDMSKTSCKIIKEVLGEVSEKGGVGIWFAELKDEANARYLVDTCCTPVASMNVGRSTDLHAFCRGN